jgi:hypothetical protein
MRLSGYSIKIQYRTQGRYCSSSPLLARPDGEISASCPLEKSPVAWKARQSKHDRGQPEISLIAIIDLPRVVSTDTLRIVMNLACAEPDKGWGQRPCEGIAPSICSCVWRRAAPARDRARHGRGQTSLIALLTSIGGKVPTGANAVVGRDLGAVQMQEDKVHCQRRHRKRPSRRRYLWIIVVTILRVLDLLMSWWE